MSVVKVTDLAYGRLRSPDLDKQEEFLTAFGMVRADRTLFNNQILISVAQG